ncbi:MAG TPA: hypothetical protein VN670_11615 [Acidobacteriaceae bacterium]|nr:hypothetical protein [Acidobacteriaceae bacterium]
MRRWAAFFLLLLTVLLPFQPLLAVAQQQASVPACCRRNGAHHCMMPQTAALNAAETHSSIASSRCPWFKRAVVPRVIATAISTYQPISHPATAGGVAIAGLPVLSFNLHRRQSTRGPPVQTL